MRAPWPRTMIGGSPPTAPKARTGEFTPPGKSRSARWCSLRDFSSFTFRNVPAGTAFAPRRHRGTEGVRGFRLSALLKGHGFSRAVRAERNRALAPEEI